MTERTKAVEDFAGIAERLKEIRRERGIPDFETGHTQTVSVPGHPPSPPLHPTLPADGGVCGLTPPGGPRPSADSYQVVNPVTGKTTWVTPRPNRSI